jgi:4-hydroxybenzoate polyprenyltransferase
VFLGIYDFLPDFFSALFCAIAVKLADDYLDKNTDALTNSFNWCQEYGDGTIIYAMLFLAVSAAFAPAIGISLFIGSYMIGMFHDLKISFPSGLTGFQESILLFIANLLFFGWNYTLFALLFVFSLQLLDDLIDIQVDKTVNRRNYAQCFGKVECVLLFMISLLTAYYLNPPVFRVVFAAVAIVFLLTLLTRRAGLKC